MGLCENMDSLIHIWLELTFFSGRWLGDISNIWIMKNITSIQFTICLYYQGMFKLSVVTQRRENSEITKVKHYILGCWRQLCPAVIFMHIGPVLYLLI